jgi:hypothetical protein
MHDFKLNLKPKKEKIVKTSIFTCRSQLPYAFAVLVLALICIGQAHAAPTVRPFGGVTSVQLSEGFIEALGALNLTPGTVEPGVLSEGIARFPIPGGGLDQATLKGDIFHVGGLSLSNHAGTTVQLFNFIIDTTGEQAVLTGLVTVDGDLVGRVPLFNLNLAQAQVEADLFQLTLKNVALDLTADAAQALNDILGVEAFEAGFNVGLAEVLALFHAPDNGMQ